MESNMNSYVPEPFAKFNLENWPIVIVKCNDLKTNDEFDDFLSKWENLGSRGEDYYFILDTRNIKNIGFTNAYSGINFIKRLKKQKEQYLKGTILIYNNQFLYYLFNMVMSFQDPVSMIYTYFTDKTYDLDYLTLFKIKDTDKNFKIFG